MSPHRGFYYFELVILSANWVVWIITNKALIRYLSDCHYQISCICHFFRTTQAKTTFLISLSNCSTSNQFFTRYFQYHFSFFILYTYCFCAANEVFVCYCLLNNYKLSKYTYLCTSKPAPLSIPFLINHQSSLPLVCNYLNL